MLEVEDVCEAVPLAEAEEVAVCADELEGEPVGGAVLLCVAVVDGELPRDRVPVTDAVCEDDSLEVADDAAVPEAEIVCEPEPDNEGMLVAMPLLVAVPVKDGVEVPVLVRGEV